MDLCWAQNCTSPISGPSPLVFSQLIQTVMAAQCSLGRVDDYPPDRTSEIVENSEESFDFIIVGGGTAGSVLAARLSDQSDWKVLLIEAGTYPSARTDVPQLSSGAKRNSEEYDYPAEPQENFCLGQVNKRCRLATGKGLGGSTTLGANAYVYGHKKDFDDWEAEGNEGWDFESVLPYFKKSANYPREIIEQYGDNYLGTEGPMSARLLNYTSSSFSETILNAVAEKGIPKIDIFNTNRYIGFTKMHVNVENGQRVNAAKAYLSPIKDKENLYVMTSTRTDQILISNNQTIGVRVTLKNGKTVDINASKEVILSAGAMESPKLLMLSGIGPKKDLDELEIDCIADLPVGQNLIDQLIWPGVFLEFANQTHVHKTDSDSQDDAYMYLAHKEGPLAAMDGFDFSGFVNVNDLNSTNPNIQFQNYYVAQGDDSMMSQVLDTFNLSPEVRDFIVNSTMTNDNLLMSAILLKPKSTGEVKLRSKSPSDSVKIFQNYLTDNRDKETLLQYVDFVESLLDTEAFKNLGMKLRKIVIPGCDNFEFDSSEYWECNLRHIAGSYNHPVGTVRMGTPDNPKSVVDSTLKVLGIDRLRVIDASIMPNIVSAGPLPATLMIAEKGADFIKNSWINKN
ncbi:glucose dehydrogenase [FAD, quinone]-like [Microplitis mediator]|uniref:glucose dehydrogenase [FAD, quinone]-like n=1 Tax=Microplitis mediator TaxID=375433 RepID=UPI002553DC5C|nr:glucose dehydrogenase [FAD, quinone]-like [Microplitis mediator]